MTVCTYVAALIPLDALCAATLSAPKLIETQMIERLGSRAYSYLLSSICVVFKRPVTVVKKRTIDKLIFVC